MNVCIFTGRLTRDPEMRQTQSGKAVCNFSMAIDTGKKNAQGQKIATFLNCTAWERTAETITGYVRKGDQITIQAEFSVREWTDRQGQPRKDALFTVWKFDIGAKAQGNQGAPPARPPQQRPGPGPGYNPQFAPRQNPHVRDSRPPVNPPPEMDDPFDGADEPQGDEPVAF